MFIGLLSICTTESFVGSLASNSKGSIKFVSLNNRPCQAKSTLVNINSMKLFFIHLLSVLISGGSCNSIDDQYVWVCVSNKVKYMNVKVFNAQDKWNKIFSSAWLVWV